MSTDNQANNKRIAKNTLFMYFRMLIIMLVSLYTSRVVLSALGFDDYGLYNVIGGIVTMFGFINAAMSNTTSRYITFHLGKSDLETQRRVFSVTVEIHIFISIIILLLAETIGLWYLYNKLVIPDGRFDAAFWLYQISILSTIIAIISVPYSAAIIAHEKMSAFAYISILDVVLKLLIVFAIQFSPIDKLIFYASLIFVVQLTDRIIYGVYCNRNFAETKFVFVKDMSLIKEMMGFAGWNLMGSFSFVFFTEGINLLINLFCGTAVNAARGISVQIETVVKQLASNVQTAINPQIIKSYASNELSRMHNLICASSRYCFYLLFLLTLPLFLKVSFVLSIWLGEFPEHTENFVRLIIINVILDTLVNPLWTANAATGKVRIYQIVVNSISLAFIPIAYFAIKFTNVPESLYVCAIVTTICCTIARFCIVMRQIDLSFNFYVKEVLFKIFYVVVFAIVVPVIVHYYSDDNWIGFIEVCICSLISVLSVVYLLGINKGEREFVRNKISILLNK